MEPFFKSTLAAILISTHFYASPVDDAKMHALFLMQQNQVSESIERYREYCTLRGSPDFEVLQQMGYTLLQKGVAEADPQSYLMTLFGAGISGSSRSLDILETGLHHPDPQVQLLSLHFIAENEETRATELLNRAMSSDFLSTRMEAAFYLCQRKHPHAVGQIEGLMFRLPPVFKPYFPSFFALLGTSDATSVLKRLLEDTDPHVRVESILNVAKAGRDDFLPLLRKRLSHSHVMEVEATLYAIGHLKDSASHAKLKKHLTSPTDTLRIASALALLQLGDRSGVPILTDLAQKHNLFAIFALGSVSETEEILAQLGQSSDLQIRINATLALLARRDVRCIPSLYEVLLTDVRDLAFQPFGSVGRTLTCLKAIPSAELRSKDPTMDLSYSLTLREHFLRDAAHLSEESFLKICRQIFEKGQNDLVPTTILLLENLRTENAIALLKEGAGKLTSPLIRDYCHLALYRLKEEGPYEEYMTHWVANQRDADLIRLRPLLPWKYRMSQSDYTLSAEETSRLLIETFLSIANRRDEKSISLILDSIQHGNPQNRYALMGLLMRATE